MAIKIPISPVHYSWDHKSTQREAFSSFIEQQLRRKKHWRVQVHHCKYRISIEEGVKCRTISTVSPPSCRHRFKCCRLSAPPVSTLHTQKHHAALYFPCSLCVTYSERTMVLPLAVVLVADISNTSQCCPIFSWNVLIFAFVLHIQLNASHLV